MAQGASILCRECTPKVPAFLFDDAPNERKSVAVDARASEPEHEVSRFDMTPGKNFLALDGSNAEACEVVIALCVHAWHFRRLAADQRTARAAAAIGDGCNDR